MLWTSLSLKPKFGIFSSSSGRFTRPTSKTRGFLQLLLRTSPLVECSIWQESEIELRDEFASRFGQFRSDRLGILETRNVVAAEAAIAADQLFAGIQVLLIGVHAARSVLAFDSVELARRNSKTTSSSAAESVCGSGFAFPLRILQRREIGRDVGGFRSGQAQAGHFGIRPNLRGSFTQLSIQLALTLLPWLARL